MIAVNLLDGKQFHDRDDLRAAFNVDGTVALLTTDARARGQVTEAVLTLLDSVLQRALAAEVTAGAPAEVVGQLVTSGRRASSVTRQ